MRWEPGHRAPPPIIVADRARRFRCTPAEKPICREWVPVSPVRGRLLAYVQYAAWCDRPESMR